MSSDAKQKVIYLCGAGGKGNAGAEAIFLAIIKLFQRRFKDVQFIITSWYPERVKELLQDIPGDFEVIGHESSFHNPLTVRRADYFVICGDVSISETVVSFLPIYYGIRTLWARIVGTPVIYLGIEAEKIRKRSNLMALKYLIDEPGASHILRNEESYANMERIPMTRSRLLLGCEPSLMLREEDLSGFECRPDALEGDRPLVGIAIRDHFSKPFKMTFPFLKLKRQDVGALGEVTDEMKQIVTFTAKIADYMVEKYDARVVFVPHHYLPVAERVIMADCEVADLIIKEMKNPGDAVVLENSLHPFKLIDIYKRFLLVFSMRHHANSFAYLHQVPVMGYDIAEKIRSFFKHVSTEDMLIDPFVSDMDPVFAQVDHAVENREAIVQHLESGLQRLRKHMNEALDAVLGAES